MAMDAELLDVLLPALESAPDEWHASGVFAVRKPPPLPPDDDPEAWVAPPPRELADVMDGELLAGSEARGATAKLASMLACVDRACRAAAERFATADERAARFTQAQAVVADRGAAAARSLAPLHRAMNDATALLAKLEAERDAAALAALRRAVADAQALLHKCLAKRARGE